MGIVRYYLSEFCGNLELSFDGKKNGNKWFRGTSQGLIKASGFNGRVLLGTNDQFTDSLLSIGVNESAKGTWDNTVSSASGNNPPLYHVIENPFITYPNQPEDIDTANIDWNRFYPDDTIYLFNCTKKNISVLAVQSVPFWDWFNVDPNKVTLKSASHSGYNPILLKPNEYLKFKWNGVFEDITDYEIYDKCTRKVLRKVVNSKPIRYDTDVKCLPKKCNSYECSECNENKEKIECKKVTDDECNNCINLTIPEKGDSTCQDHKMIVTTNCDTGCKDVTFENPEKDC